MIFARTRRRGRVQSTKTQAWPAPIKGWFASGNVTDGPADSAEQLDNYFPTARGARLRKGKVKHATVGATPQRFVTYQSGDLSRLYASTETALYEISSPADATVAPTPSMSQLTSGDWSDVQFSTAGGDFMIAVNGSDYAFYDDGIELNPISGEAISDLGYDALTAGFTVGQMVVGGTSGATATIYAVIPSSATAGTLKIGAVTAGPFQDNEALTDPQGGAATSNIPSGVTSASAVTITGVDTSSLSQVWHFKERVFFVEDLSLNAWYLPVNSIGGAASKLNLGAIFREGGKLLFGATWSIDSGDGLDDKCIFVTDQGEVAVYQGTDPSSASTWGLVGVYRIGNPVNKHGSFQIGGDVIILTDDGLLPVSQAIKKDRTQLATGALTFPIEDAWKLAIASRDGLYPITATLWQSQGVLLVGTPVSDDGTNIAFVANARTGAWCRYTGWDVRCSVVHDEALYFGSDGGVIYQGEVGGTDDGTAYTGTWIPRFSESNTPNIKIANHAQLIARAAVPVICNAKAFSDYEIGTIMPPAPLPDPSTSAAWGAATWGDFLWGGETVTVARSQWKTVAAQGFSIAPGFAVTSNQTDEPFFEITAALLRYEVGSVL